MKHNSNEEEEKKENRQARIFAITVVGLVFAFGIFGMPFIFSTWVSADVMHTVTLIESGKGDSVGAIALMSHNVIPGGYGSSANFNLDLIDAASGKRLVRKKNIDSQKCHGANDTSLWCFDHQFRLEKRSGKDLEVVKSFDEIESMNPQLKGGIRNDPQWTQDNAALLMTQDGRHWKLDPNTLKASEVKDPKTLNLESGFQLTTMNTYWKEREKSFFFKGHPRKELMLRSDDGEQPLASGKTFLDPRILSAPYAGGFLFYSKTSLKNSEANSIITAVTDDGKIAWSTELPGPGFPLFAQSRRHTLYVTVSDPTNMLLALDLKKGRIKWRYQP